MRKIKDLSVKTGTYEKNGETKGRYENIGSLFDDGKGGQFILLKRTFNPAGVSVDPGKDQIVVSIFNLKDSDQAPAPRRDPPPPRTESFPDDDIPF